MEKPREKNIVTAQEKKRELTWKVKEENMGETQFENFIRKVIAEEIEILRTKENIKEREIAHLTLNTISQFVKITL